MSGVNEWPDTGVAAKPGTVLIDMTVAEARQLASRLGKNDWLAHRLQSYAEIAANLNARKEKTT